MRLRLAAAALVAGLAAVIAAVALAGSGDDAGAGPAGGASWRAHASSPFERTEVGAARVGRFVYVAGGFEKATGVTTRAVARYDLERDRWTLVKPLPQGVNHPAVTAIGGKVYVSGGYTSPREFDAVSARLYAYDPKRNSWKRLRDAPTARAAHTMQAVGGKLYAVGGVTLDGPLTTLEVYDLRRKTWSRGPGMPTAREHLASAVAGGRVYVLAGRTGSAGNFAIVESYDPRTRRWRKEPPMRKPRGGIAAATVGDKVVVFGGEEGAGTIAEVEAFDASERRWSSLADMRTPRHGLGGISYRGRVYALEGGPEPGFFFSNAVESLQIAR
jgi:N-acetylneuraminic acid mutarotase